MNERRVKYPRTPHLPWSPGVTSDDKVARSLDALTAARAVVVTEKQDGEATTVYPDGYSHARSVSSAPHPSRTHIRALAARLAGDIPPGWRVCGENLYAVHSIRYHALPAYFQVYSVWNHDECLSWTDTVEWCDLLGVHPVPVIYEGPMLPSGALTRLWRQATAGRDSEGYVVRVAHSFPAADFGRCVLKYVRSGHVQTDDHWTAQAVRVNGLA